MKGTIREFLHLATETPELATELVRLAGRFGFEFAESDERSEMELDEVVGGTSGVAGFDVSSQTLQAVLAAATRDAATEADLSEAAANMKLGGKTDEIGRLTGG